MTPLLLGPQDRVPGGSEIKYDYSGVSTMPRPEPITVYHCSVIGDKPTLWTETWRRYDRTIIDNDGHFLFSVPAWMATADAAIEDFRKELRQGIEVSKRGLVRWAHYPLRLEASRYQLEYCTKMLAAEVVSV